MFLLWLWEFWVCLDLGFDRCLFLICGALIGVLLGGVFVCFVGVILLGFDLVAGYLYLLCVFWFVGWGVRRTCFCV